MGILLGGFLLSQPVSAGITSRELLEAGPHIVASRTLTLIDTERPTQANGTKPAKNSRSLKTTIWYPAQPRAAEILRPGPTPLAETEAGFPLVIYSHGFMSNRKGSRYLLEHLASHGYVAAAANFPLTTFFAAGGPLVADVVHQPRDLSFLIDSLLAWGGDPHSDFHGRIDPNRIALFGVSLGGMTTTLATFHPTLGDPRIKAAASVGGPTSMFSEIFFEHAEVPFLMLATTYDAMVPYETNAADLLVRAPDTTLVTLEGGSHTAFANLADPWMSWMRNPDSLGCSAISKNIPEDRSFLELLGGAEEGILVDGATLPCELDPLPRVLLTPRRQHQLTTLAVYSFFESLLASSPERRASMQDFLLRVLPSENAEISVERSAPKSGRQ